MAANKLIFKDAEKARDAILDSQKKEIENLYKDWAKEVGELADYYSHKTAPSYVVAERQMKELMKQMEATSHEVANEIHTGVKKNIYLVADSVVQQNVEWLKSLGFASDTLDAAFNYVPDEIVRNITTGQIYDSGWSLSKRIWSDNEDTMKQAYQIVAGGVAQNKPMYEIAKDLEKYVSPSAAKPWNLRAPDGKKIYPKQVDYNAQRLGRTLVQHGYQQSFVVTTQKNPFITDYIWIANGSRVCEFCQEMNGKHFPKDDLPLDHPNGMCTMVPNVVDDLTGQLTDWFNSEDGTYPEIDEFAKNFGYKAKTSSKESADILSAFKDKFGDVNQDNAPMKFKSNLNDDDYKEWLGLQKQVKKDLGYTPGSGLDFWEDYSTGKVKSKEIDNFFAKVLNDVQTTKAATTSATDSVASLGTSSGKTFNYWYTKLSADQKAVAQNLKGSSGLTWQQWYEKNIYVGDGQNLTTKKKVVTEVFEKQQWLDSLHANDLRKMEGWTDDWVAQLSSEERYGVEVYTSDAYRDINRYLRGITDYTDYADEIEHAKSALTKAKLPETTITRRGSDFDSLKHLLGEERSSNVFAKKDSYIGMVVQDKGFMSTSPAPRGGFTDNIEYVIKVPAGTDAMYVDTISQNRGEQELLLNAGTKFIVEDFEANSYSEITKVFLKVIKK